MSVKTLLTLNGYQIRSALAFVAPDATHEPKNDKEAQILESELETDLSFGMFEAGKDEESGEEMPAGLYCWLTEYPEEGRIHLPEIAARK